MKTKLSLILFISFLGILTLVLGAFSILSMWSPVKLADELNQQFEMNKDEVDENVTQTDNHIAFLKARLAMAETDSVCLSLNLNDSTLILELKGVQVYMTKITSIDISPFFYRIRPQIIQNWIENPFTIDHYLSTIPGQFILQKEAPNDTTELASSFTLPDTVQRESVCYELYLDRGVRLLIQEINPPNDKAFKQFNRDLRKETIHSLLGSMVYLEVPKYNPWIAIEIPGRKAKTIIRSLPDHAKVAIWF